MQRVQCVRDVANRGLSPIIRETWETVVCPHLLCPFAMRERYCISEAGTTAGPWWVIFFSRALDELLGPARHQGDGFARAAAILRRAAAREGVVLFLPRRCQISVASAVADRHNASYQR